MTSENQTMTMIMSLDARGATEPRAVAPQTDIVGVDDAVVRAEAASRVLAASSRADRARLLRALASALEARGAEIIAAADRETALGVPRLTGELARTSFQLRHFAEVVEDGHYLAATIDHADPDASPAPRPDLRRMLVPIGPVAVFSASNFPLAFSVAGGDTASAIAAGNAVVVKAHSGHPLTSMLTARALRAGAAEAGFPDDVVTVVFGTRAGVDLITHPLVAAGAFTGSTAGGRALFDLAAARPVPIPFYGELGSINALVVTDAALAERSAEIAAGLAASFTLGAGQFCTKPGLVLVPAGAAGDALAESVREAASQVEPAPMLNSRVRDGWSASIATLTASPHATTLLHGDEPGALAAGVVLVSMEARDVIAAGADALAFEECFGPSTLLVRYTTTAELDEVVRLVPGSLTGTVHGGSEEEHGASVAAHAYRALAERCGRVLWNQFPTGVSVTWAMQHGGPYPATTAAGSTSVGASAILRFLRPVAFQNAPDLLLPAELRDDNPTGVPRRVDGRLDPTPEEL
ncbi:aldehyde dehydrogenase (NADP(+)) [Agromyces ramosus]|uniref:NADP-dependent aldehyde dehydrogenase n=1 Tax=Agromyces ramosus TaxID=33879 RepID=A0ABU0RAP9_9MICO|nr:aldehyde dehydrogenase (NADP(+)) [Agromyces ramosus]MDQ0895141.1 NADP-dependent aldehyde dehydrogenase [Agromyces ramosus]